MAMSLLRGRRYNRTKGSQGGDRKSTGQNVRLIDNASALAAEHGVDEKTIRRDGKFAKAAEDLGIESEIISGEIEATKQEIVLGGAPSCGLSPVTVRGLGRVFTNQIEKSGILGSPVADF